MEGNETMSGLVKKEKQHEFLAYCWGYCHLEAETRGWLFLSGLLEQGVEFDIRYSGGAIRNPLTKEQAGNAYREYIAGTWSCDYGRGASIYGPPLDLAQHFGLV